MLWLRLPLALSLAVVSGCGDDDVPKFAHRRDDTDRRQCLEETPVPRRDAGGGGGVDAGGPGFDAGGSSGLPDAGASGMGGGADGDGGAGFDAGRRIGCDPGQVCLRGRCYDGCTSDATCLGGEMCTGGVCVERTTPRFDAGMPDTGPINRCTGVMCMGAQVCHPATGTCVECTDATQCSAAVPICELAAGTCRAFSAGLCAPCNNTPDCRGLPETGSDGECRTLETPALERVCVVSCPDGVTCPAGMRCADAVCVPIVGSCTNWRAAATARACTTDTECEALGTIPSTGVCMGMVCQSPCGVSMDCPTARPTCTAGFCTP